MCTYNSTRFFARTNAFKYVFECAKMCQKSVLWTFVLEISCSIGHQSNGYNNQFEGYIHGKISFEWHYTLRLWKYSRWSQHFQIKFNQNNCIDQFYEQTSCLSFNNHHYRDAINVLLYNFSNQHTAFPSHITQVASQLHFSGPLYGDVIMGAVTFQITRLTIVYPSVYSGADQRKLQSSASLAFVRGIHRRPGNSLHKWPVMRKMFPFDDVIMYTMNTYDHQLNSYFNEKKQTEPQKREGKLLVFVISVISPGDLRTSGASPPGMLLILGALMGRVKRQGDPTRNLHGNW